jgi:hypothetical protein
MAAALLDVAEGRVPKDRLALKCLIEEMLAWPFLGEDGAAAAADAKASVSGASSSSSSKSSGEMEVVIDEGGWRKQQEPAVQVMQCYVVCGLTVLTESLQLCGRNRAQKHCADLLCKLIITCTGDVTADSCLVITRGAVLLGWGIACPVCPDWATHRELTHAALHLPHVRPCRCCHSLPASPSLHPMLSAQLIAVP